MRRSAIVLLILASSAAAEPAPTEPSDTTLSALHVGRGCLRSGERIVDLPVPLFDYFADRPGAFYFASSGTSALTDGGRFLFSEGDAADGTRVTAVLEALPERVVVEEDVPVLVSRWEVHFQFPYRGRTDWLSVIETEARRQGHFGDTRRLRGTLVRYTHPDAGSALMLELPDAAPMRRDPLEWRRAPAYLGVVQAEDDSVHLYSLARSVGWGPRVKAELDRLGKSLPDDRLVVHSGGALGRTADAREHARCGATLKALGLDAIVPGRGDLQLGVEALRRFSATYALPFLAANLEATVEGEEPSTPFPPFRVVEVDGLKVALVGLVGRDRVDTLPAAARAQWRLSEPGKALDRTMKSLHAEIPGGPDLTIVLVAASGDDYRSVTFRRDVDVVLGRPRGWDLVERTQTIEIANSNGGREGARDQRPLLEVFSARANVGRIDATFTRSPDGARLRRLRHHLVPVLPEGPVDPAMQRELRVLEEADVPRQSELMLPDPAPVVARHPALRELVWGRVARDSRTWEYPDTLPAYYSVPLWMRFVTNALRTRLGADLVVLPRLLRSTSTVGPVARVYLEDWLATQEPVRLYTLDGAALLTIASRLRRQKTPGAVGRHAQLFSSGIDPKASRVGGRAVDLGERYTVAVTDSVTTDPELAPIFRGRVPDSAPPRPLGPTVMDILEGWLDPQTRQYRDSARPALEDLLLDHSGRLEGQWSVRIRELTITTSRYANYGERENLAVTGEARVLAPDSYSVGGKADVALLYDGPSVAWENRTQARLQRLVLDLPDVPPQEQADDLVVWTELRLNAVRAQVGSAGATVVPFIRSAYDTELTAPPDVTSSDPDATGPRQKVLRETLGVVVVPGAFLKEVRLGGLFQYDVTEADAHGDFGLTAGYALVWPLWGPLTFTSDLDVRYLVPDDDDRDTDLALKLESPNRLVLDLGVLDFFVFTDVYLARGKTAQNDSLGGSWILGGGLQLARVFKL